MFPNSHSRLEWTFRVLLIAILATLILSPKVWLCDRNFPIVPIFENTPIIPHPIDYIIYCVLIVLSTYLIVSLHDEKTKKIFFGLFAFTMLYDQMRWQPYNVHYLLMLAGFLYFPNNGDKIIPVFRLFIITFLIWSGIQEMNDVFADRVYPSIWSKSFAEKFPSKFEGYITGSGYIFALLQILSGIGLFFDRSRNISIYTAIFTHVFLLYGANPFEIDVNRVSPLYNLISSLFIFILFKDSSFSPQEVFWSKDFRFHQVCVIFYAILPVLSLFNVYDRMQSFNLYSGKGWYAKIYVNEALVEKLPEGMKRYVDRPFGSEPYIETTYWANKELKVSPYSEKRVYDRLLNYVCKYAEGDCTARIEYYTW